MCMCQSMQWCLCGSMCPSIHIYSCMCQLLFGGEDLSFRNPFSTCTILGWGINLACLYIWTMNNLTGPPQFGICLKSHSVMIGDIRLQKMTANMADFEQWMFGAFYFPSSPPVWWGFLADEHLYLMVPSDLWLQTETLSLSWGSCPILETLSSPFITLRE